MIEDEDTAGAPDAPPALPQLRPEEARALERILGLVRRLRAPDGCPWDREQTLGSMGPYILEEAYEVVDAIDRDDDAGLREELGDLFFLLLFCTEIAREGGRFGVADVLQRQIAKMTARHPHVFGNSRAISSGAVAQQWEEIKRSERPASGDQPASVLDGRLPALPGLTAAYRIQEKAAAVGFDWPAIEPVLDKVEEELRELRVELQDPSPRNEAHRRRELGDLLFALVNLSRVLAIDPEAALRSTTARFVRRFRYIEGELARRGKRPADASLSEMDALWDEAKRCEEADEASS